MDKTAKVDPLAVVAQGGTAQGSFIIRYPAPGDAPAMYRYINALSQEKTFILFQGEEIPLEFEQSYLEGQLEKIAQRTLVQLLATAGDEVIGVSEIGIKGRVESHIGDFGISVASGWRGLGVGTALLQAVLDEAQIHLPALEIVTLTVFANNETAIKMYRRFGFEEFGRLPGGIIHRSQHIDHIYMYKVIR
jgi:ribosomal protein S18 acetylase RimI-like enzyme